MPLPGANEFLAASIRYDSESAGCRQQNSRAPLDHLQTSLPNECLSEVRRIRLGLLNPFHVFRGFASSFSR